MASLISAVCATMRSAFEPFGMMPIGRVTRPRRSSEILDEANVGARLLDQNSCLCGAGRPIRPPCA